MRRRARGALALACALATSCAGGAAPAPSASPSGASPTPAPSASATVAAPLPHVVDVRYDPKADTWEVAWTFREPTVGILFDRRDPSNRHETWVPGDGLGWSMDGGSERLSPLDGAARTTFSARFPTSLASHGRAPPLNVAFSNGDRLLFTSQLGVHALACPEGGARCDRRGMDEPRVFRFHTDATRGLRALERAAKGDLEWPEPSGDLRGTYVYTGNLAATDQGRFTLLSDPGLPDWLRTRTTELLPALVEHHARAIGIELDFEPLVFASQGDAKPGAGLRGRTLPALIQLEAYGAGWAEKTEALEALWFEFLAHETFHLWNTQLARRGEEKRNEWLSEGSAVYAAGLALLDAGLLNRARFDRRILDAANGCISRLRGPLFDEKASDAYYDCGSVLLFAVDRELASSSGVMATLATLFDGARTAGAPWETKAWRAIVEARAPTKDLVADVNAFLDVGLGADPTAFMIRLLGRAGLKVEASQGKGKPALRLAP